MVLEMRGAKTFPQSVLENAGLTNLADYNPNFRRHNEKVVGDSPSHRFRIESHE